MSKYLFQEDDALIHGQDPDYPGIHGWWEKQFPGRVFRIDWASAVSTEEDHQDAFIRTLVVGDVSYRVQYSFDGYAVENPKEKL